MKIRPINAKTLVYLVPSLIVLFLMPPFLITAHGQDWSKEKKVAATNIGGIAVVTAWGMFNWDYFEKSPGKAHEGWFAEDSPEGGADKCAHFYFSYTLSHTLSAVYEDWGYDREPAALLGALSSFGIMGYMELGDSFSDYGFSSEDFAMNLLGSAAGYLLYRNASLAEKVDFRMEYIPRFDGSGLITDYDHMKFLMAVRLSGFESTRHTAARYLELHLGYYARDYPRFSDRERNIYFGIGISLPAIFSKLSMKKTATVFNYYQLPYTYISLDKDLNR